MGFTHLHVHSNFSFLDGGSSIQALIDRAKEIGCESLALTDHNGLYGAIRFYDYALKVGVKPIVGVEMDVEGSGKCIQAIAAGTLDRGNMQAQWVQPFPQQRREKADSSHSFGMTADGAPPPPPPHPKPRNQHPPGEGGD